MLSLDDNRWVTLTAGYRTPIDLRPLLRRLESASDAQPIWDQLWQELYHQGDVGPGSFVAVPHLVRIHAARGIVDWNTYAIVSTIELARGNDGNPDVLDLDRKPYEDALRELAALGVRELPRATNAEAVRSIIGLLAIVYGARTYGRILVEFTEDELLELEAQAFGDSADAV